MECIDAYLTVKIFGTQYPSLDIGGSSSFGYKGFRVSADLQGLADAYSYGTCEYYYPHGRDLILQRIG